MRDTDPKSPTVRSSGEPLWPLMPRSRENRMLHASCGVLHMTPVTRAGGFLKGEPRRKDGETAGLAASVQQSDLELLNFGS